jgi:hypothetical protein
MKAHGAGIGTPRGHDFQSRTSRWRRKVWCHPHRGGACIPTTQDERPRPDVASWMPHVAPENLPAATEEAADLLGRED